MLSYNFFIKAVCERVCVYTRFGLTLELKIYYFYFRLKKERNYKQLFELSGIIYLAYEAYIMFNINDKKLLLLKDKLMF